MHHCDGSQAECHSDHLKGSKFHQDSEVDCLYAVLRIRTEPCGVLAQGQDLHLRKSSPLEHLMAWRDNYNIIGSTVQRRISIKILDTVVLLVA